MFASLFFCQIVFSAIWFEPVITPELESRGVKIVYEYKVND